MKKLFCAACAFGFGAVSAFAAVYEFRDRSKDVSYLDASYWQIYFESSTVPATTPPSSGDAVYVTSGNDIEVFVDGSVSENYSYIPRLTVDGIYGNATENAVRIIQERNSIPVSGIVGPVTWYAIIRLAQLE